MGAADFLKLAEPEHILKGAGCLKADVTRKCMLSVQLEEQGKVV
jgi:hypothetical protein